MPSYLYLTLLFPPMPDYDCGVFTCMFADFILADCPLNFSQEEIDHCREKIALSIMKNCAMV